MHLADKCSIPDGTATVFKNIAKIGKPGVELSPFLNLDFDNSGLYLNSVFFANLSIADLHVLSVKSFVLSSGPSGALP